MCAMRTMLHICLYIVAANVEVTVYPERPASSWRAILAGIGSYARMTEAMDAHLLLGCQLLAVCPPSPSLTACV